MAKRTRHRNPLFSLASRRAPACPTEACPTEGPTDAWEVPEECLPCIAEADEREPPALYQFVAEAITGVRAVHGEDVAAEAWALNLCEAHRARIPEEARIRLALLESRCPLCAAREHGFDAFEHMMLAAHMALSTDNVNAGDNLFPIDVLCREHCAELYPKLYPFIVGMPS